MIGAKLQSRFTSFTFRLSLLFPLAKSTVRDTRSARSSWRPREEETIWSEGGSGGAAAAVASYVKEGETGPPPSTPEAVRTFAGRYICQVMWAAAAAASTVLSDLRPLITDREGGRNRRRLGGASAVREPISL